MTVKVRENDISEIVARGSVVLTQGDYRGSADEAVYDVAAETVTLSGKYAEVIDKKQGVVRGSRLIVNTAGNKMAVLSEGSGKTTTQYKVQK
jgi:lipopolysaccharide export system protein LptA